MPTPKHLVSTLAGQHSGKPILVICGGPSAAHDLPLIPHDFPKCVISANEHGYKQTRFKTDYIVGVDFSYGNNGKPLMSEFVKQFPAKTINRWSWADYRIPDLEYTGDSGMTAVLVAAYLGGDPVVVVGLDRYAGQRRYFWHTGPDRAWQRRRPPEPDAVKTAFENLRYRCQGARVFALSGPFASVFPAGRNPFARVEGTVLARHRAFEEAEIQVRVKQGIFLHPLDKVAPGTLMPMTAIELRRYHAPVAVEAVV